MGIIHIMERKGSSDYKEYKKALKMAKEAIDIICELTGEMDEEYGYEERKGYSRREEWDDAGEHGVHMRRYR